MSEPLTQVRQISHIAYGFMASRALFAALKIGLFEHISSGVQTLEALCAATGVAEHRLKTLMAVLVSLGLVVREEDQFTNAPATERYWSLIRLSIWPAYAEAINCAAASW